MNGSCIVAYDKSKRKWLCTSPSGQIATFPPGKEGRRGAELLSIKITIPQVSKYLEHLETTGFDKKSLRRAFDGALLLTSHLVVEPNHKRHSDNPKVVAEIIKENSEETYVIMKNLDKYSLYYCSCTDYYKNMATFRTTPTKFLDQLESPYIKGVGIVCKHIWAYHFGFLTNTISQEAKS